MTELTAQCQQCGERLVLPLPDAWQTEQGALIDKDHISQEDNEAQLTAMMEELACPTCHLPTMRVVGVAEGRHEGTIPVYLPYVLYLERYVEVPAASMEEAKAIVKQMVREDRIQRPSYTEGLADWTEVADGPTSHFLIDGEAM